MADKQELVNKMLELDPKNHWGIMGLQPSNKEQVKKQYKTLAIQIHPDKNSHPKATEAFQRLHNAYLALTTGAEPQVAATQQDATYWTAFWRKYYEQKPYHEKQKKPRPPKSKKPPQAKRPPAAEAAANRAYQEAQQRQQAEAERKKAEKEKERQSAFFAGLKEVKNERASKPTI